MLKKVRFQPFSGAVREVEVYMHVAREAVTIVLFAVSSWVAMNGAYFQFNLLLGLGKTLDCWCGDMLETQNFIGGISSWNSLQAMLKCVGREVTWCFTVLISLGYIGLFISLAASLSLFLEPDLDIGSVKSRVSKIQQMPALPEMLQLICNRWRQTNIYTS